MTGKQRREQLLDIGRRLFAELGHRRRQLLDQGLDVSGRDRRRYRLRRRHAAIGHRVRLQGKDPSSRRRVLENETVSG